MYFTKHALNTRTGNEFDVSTMYKEAYEQLVESQIRLAVHHNSHSVFLGSTFLKMSRSCSQFLIILNFFYRFLSEKLQLPWIEFVLKLIFIISYYAVFLVWRKFFLLNIINSSKYYAHRIATILDHTQTPCSTDSFVPSQTSTNDKKIYVYYIYQKQAGDYETWNNVARCFKLWDLDVRGFHKQMWRFWIKESQMFVVGSSSPYFKFKPEGVTPIFIKKRSRNKGANDKDDDD